MPVQPSLRSWVPPLLLVASAVATNVALVMGVLVLPSSRPTGGAAVVQVMTFGFAFAAAALFVVGCVLAIRRAGSEAPRFVRWFTVALLLLGLLSLLLVLLYEWVIRRHAATSDGSSTGALRYTQAICAAYTLCLLVGGVLRMVRSRLALTWTTCVCLLLLPFIPFGTAVGAVWLATVRSRETPSP